MTISPVEKATNIPDAKIDNEGVENSSHKSSESEGTLNKKIGVVSKGVFDKADEVIVQACEQGIQKEASVTESVKLISRAERSLPTIEELKGRIQEEYQRISQEIRLLVPWIALAYFESKCTSFATALDEAKNFPDLQKVLEETIGNIVIAEEYFSWIIPNELLKKLATQKKTLSDEVERIKQTLV
jgi:hypothetical protein